MVRKYNAVFLVEKYMKDGVGYITKTQTPSVEVFVYCTIFYTKRWWFLEYLQLSIAVLISNSEQ